MMKVDCVCFLVGTSIYGQYHAVHEEHHMGQLKTVFREEGEDRMTVATIDITIAHMIVQSEDLNIKLLKF